MVIAYTVLLILHAANPAKHSTAGGLENFSGSMDVLSHLGVVAAILVGATLGAGDHSSGVFRELVVTGRSRLDLFAARVPAGIGLVLAVVGAAFALTATASTVFAGSSDAPAAGLLISAAAWLALLAVSAAGQPTWVAAVLGTGAIPFLLDGACYYSAFLAAWGLLWLRREAVGVGLCALATGRS